MTSVYQLLSLLLVFCSLRVDELEACSCSLVHPQDAFCNSDIGKQRFLVALTLPPTPQGLVRVHFETYRTTWNWELECAHV